jgi:hypothetical protein
MSERPTSMTALEQGTLGRASGWFKITKNRSVTTLFSDDVSKIIIKARKLYDVHRKKIPVIKPSSHSLKNWREPSYRMSITIDLHEGHMWDRMSHDLRNKFRRINDVIMGQIDFDEKGSPFTKTPKKGEQWELVGDDFRQAYYGQDAKTKKAWVFFNIFGILTKDNLSEIEALYGEEFGSEISLLLPLECRNDDGHRHYSAADATHVHFALRNWESAEQQGKGRFSVTGSRETRGKDGKQRSLRHESLKGVLDMSALLSYKEKRVRGLTFILTDNAQDRKGVLEETADFTFPKPNTAPYKHFTTADDRDIINNLIKSKLVA